MNNFNLDDYLNNMLLNGIVPNNNINNFNPSDNAMDNNAALYGPYEGFLKGNLFSSLYIPYKNYKPAKLTPNSEYEEDLLNLNQMQFAYHELNLLLDNYPNDQDVLNLFNKYRQSFNDLLQKFEDKYGPITILSDDLNNTPWAWDNEPWPWEGDAN